MLRAAVGFSLFIQGRLIDEPLFVFQPCTFLNLKSQFILGKCEGAVEGFGGGGGGGGGGLGGSE